MHHRVNTIAALSALSLMMAGCSSNTNVQAATPTGVQNILLVHGAWADGSSWSKVIPLLRADGYNVVAVQLPLTSLAEDAKAVQRAIAPEPGATLLVGHSYGGAVITQAGDDPKVKGLLYVNAFAPDVGESAYGLGNTVAPHAGSTGGAPRRSGLSKTHFNGHLG